MSKFKFNPGKNIDECGGNTNGVRAERAEATLRFYKTHGLGESGAPDNECMRDLISDLMHWFDREGYADVLEDGQEEIANALRRWEEER